MPLYISLGTDEYAMSRIGRQSKNRIKMPQHFFTKSGRLPFLFELFVQIFMPDFYSQKPSL